MVGWHSAPTPGPITAIRRCSPTSRPTRVEVAKAAAFYAVVDSDGTANVILFTDSIYAIATAKTNADGRGSRAAQGCKVLEVEDTPIGDLSNRMGQLTTSLLTKYGKTWTYASPSTISILISRRRRCSPPASIRRQAIRARSPSGDGSVPAFQRIRQKRYQIATVAEPLHLQGWMCIDELNRAFAGQPPSGFVPPPHLFIASNLDRDGGPNNVYEPENGYKDIYKKIWGK